MTATINASTTAGVVTTADTSGILQLQTNGTAALTIDASQNTTLAGTLTSTGVTTFAAGTAALPAITTTGDTNTGIFFPAADTIGFAEGGAEAMRIDSSGNLGIGTSSPVFGDGSGIEVSRSGTATFRATSNSQGVEFRGNAGTAEIDTRSAFPIKLLTNQIERVRIDSSGNLLVNQTSQITGEKVGISFDRTAQQGLAIKNTSSTSPSNASYVVFFYASTNTGSIGSTGTTTSYATTSDYRLKEAIAPMTGALAKITALKPVTYKWKSTGEADEGFIAHELQAVCPSAVTGEKDAVDADGNPQYQGIDTSFLVATLTAALQELKAIVDAQGAEIAALKGATA